MGAIVMANELLRENTTGTLALQARWLLYNCYLADRNIKECRRVLDEMIHQAGLKDPIGQRAARERIRTYAITQQTTVALAQTESFIQAVKPGTPFWADLMLTRSYFLRALDQLTSAQKVLAQVLTDKEVPEGGRVQALELLGGAYETTKTAAAGIGFFQKYLDDQPTTSVVPDVWRIMARLASVVKDKEREEKFWAKCFESFGQMYDQATGADNKITILVRYARAHNLKGEVEQAAELIQKAIKDFPTSPSRLALYYELGKLYFNNEKYDKAIEAYRKVTTEFPNDPMRADAYLFIAKAHAQQKKYDAAIADCEEIKALFPNTQYAQGAAMGIKSIEAMRRKEAETSATLAASPLTSGTAGITSATAPVKPPLAPPLPPPAPKPAGSTTAPLTAPTSPKPPAK